MVACGASSRESSPAPLTEIHTASHKTPIQNPYQIPYQHVQNIAVRFLCWDNPNKDKVSTGLKRCLSRESTLSWWREPGSQPGGGAQICPQPFYPQRADRSCSSPLQNSGNGTLFPKSRESSQLFLPFPRTADFTHGLQRICAPAPKAKTVRRILQRI